MDSSNDSNCLKLHKPNGGSFKFTPSPSNGLYWLPLQSAMSEDGTTMWSFITTVSNQASRYTTQQFQAAKERARNMQNIIMHPGDQQLAKTAIHHLVNCPVTEADVRNATDIFGTNLGS
jgi:hypothetical protein